jgi:hypothetical protein
MFFLSYHNLPGLSCAWSLVSGSWNWPSTTFRYMAHMTNSGKTIDPQLDSIQRMTCADSNPTCPFLYKAHSLTHPRQEPPLPHEWNGNVPNHHWCLLNRLKTLQISHKAGVMSLLMESFKVQQEWPQHNTV